MTMQHGLWIGLSTGLVLLGFVTTCLILAFRDTKQVSRVLGQITSARWLLAVMAGVAFVMFCVAVALTILAQKETFKPETVVALVGSLLLVIQGVYKDYFHRSREADPAEGDGSALPPPERKLPEVKPPEVKPPA